ncbi:hypothetical protein C8J57DRAFT_1512866 [Mycena rebaudengoi]|nr:hypothetical protein C8J57DRAFT_1512866 [Mycena rebaudengoi]
MELGGVVLPAELERAVFEAAAVLDYRNILRLLLVAQRAHTCGQVPWPWLHGL